VWRGRRFADGGGQLPEPALTLADLRAVGDATDRTADRGGDVDDDDQCRPSPVGDRA
jgi:hypothetical protein